MSLRTHINIERLHHAYLIEGDRQVVIDELVVILSEMGIVASGNPDFHLYQHDAFLLDDAHQLRSEQSMHAASGSQKIFIVTFNTMLSEAQNALLKTLEEPTDGTHFFFITRTGEILFPAVRSRMQIVSHQSPATSHQSEDGEKFICATIPERLKMVERYTKAKADEKGEAKEAARIFLESLETALYRRIPNSLSNDRDVGISEKNTSALENVILAKRYLSDRAPSLKLLLEHLALTVPVRKNATQPFVA